MRNNFQHNFRTPFYDGYPGKKVSFGQNKILISFFFFFFFWGFGYLKIGEKEKSHLKAYRNLKYHKISILFKKYKFTFFSDHIFTFFGFRFLGTLVQTIYHMGKLFFVVQHQPFLSIVTREKIDLALV